MEYLEKIFKRTGWTSLLTSLIFAILGILLIVNPVGSTKAVSLIVGILFIVVGLYKLVDYCTTRGKYSFYNYDIAYGIIAIIIGIIAKTNIAIIAPISLLPFDPTNICITTGIVLYSVDKPITKYGNR